MSALGKWMEVTEVPRGTTKRTTSVWEVKDRRGGMLGYVEWEGAWRQYVFNPGVATFSTGCLRDLIGFIDGVNNDHRRRLYAQKGKP